MGRMKDLDQEMDSLLDEIADDQRRRTIENLAPAEVEACRDPDPPKA